MAEPFEVDVILTGEAARRFREYDANSWAHETEESQEIARRAREIVEKYKYCPHCKEYIGDRIF